MFANHISGKNLHLECKKNSQNLKVETKKVQLKNDQKIGKTDILPKRIHRWQISEQEEVEHHYFHNMILSHTYTNTNRYF